MRCVHCAEDIKFIATVCPHCHRETKQSQQQHIILVAISLGSVIPAYLIGEVFNNFLVGVGSWFVLVVILISKYTNQVKEDIPRVRIEPK